MAFEYTFGNLKTMVKRILDRQDIDDDTLSFGVYTAFQRLQRTARLPSMEITATFTQPAGQDWIPVFDNMIEVKHFMKPNGLLERKSLDYVLQLDSLSGDPQYFCRSDEIWQVWPTPDSDIDFTITYYAEFDKMLLDTQTNNTVIIAFDVILYGALSCLGEIYADERVPQWEDRFRAEVEELKAQAMDQEIAGSEVVVMPPEGSVY